MCLALSALAFVQDPGQVAADTKLDLTVDPWGFLSRAMHLWDPQGFFGQLQNQAYGYLVPIGPFFVAGDLVGLPEWVVQRLWWSLLLTLAFLGTVRLARLLGVRRPLARVVAGLAYALAPRMMTSLGPISVEVLPMALAPWVLIPLVRGSLVGSPRRWAALSGLAVFAVGGVNASATLAVLPLGVWFLITRSPGPRRRSLATWWTLSVALACTWWAIPLVILGRYSPPFLDWIESAAITTGRNDPDAVLRGTTQWVAYLSDLGGPIWQGGWALVTSPALLAAAAAVAVVGLAGMAARRVPERAFLVGGVLIGFLLVSLGHTGVLRGLWSGELQSAMDGLLAPLRNVHKFDPVLRLPICLGVGLATQRLLRSRNRASKPSAPSRARLLPLVGVAAVATLVLTQAAPALTGSLTRNRSFAAVPTYWKEAADWMAQRAPDGKALVVPGASFGVYLWGRSQDEPLQPIAQSPWAVRDAVPLSSAGNIRWLDAVQERLADGRGSPGLADALNRAGVRWLVVRNDLDLARTGAPRSVLVHQALARSPGLVPVAGFGPVLPPYRTLDTVVDDGLQDSYTAVEVWAVNGAEAGLSPLVVLRDAASPMAFSGASESVVDLADAGLLGSATAIMDGDAVPAGAIPREAVTDGYRRVEVNFGRVWDNRSATLTADEPFTQARRVHDYQPVDPAGRQAVADFAGAVASASSSGADPTALRGRSPAAQPWSAIDGDPSTAWVSGNVRDGLGQWWQVDLPQPVSGTTAEISFSVGGQVGAGPTRIRVVTEGGEADVRVRPDSEPQDIRLPGGATRWIRVELTEVDGGGAGDGFAIREFSLPGVTSARTVVTAGTLGAGGAVLSARRGERAGCVTAAGAFACSDSLGRSGEEASGLVRTVDVVTDTTVVPRIALRARPGLGLERVIAPLGPAVRVEASSRLVSDPAARPQSAADASRATSWVASPFDPDPTLTLRWRRPATVTGLAFSFHPSLAASRPLRITVTGGGLTTSTFVDSDGAVDLPPRVTDELRVRIDSVSVVRSLDPVTQVGRDLPVGVSEIDVLGLRTPPKGASPAQEVRLQCGFGPRVLVDGVVVADTSVRTTIGSILADQQIVAEPCGIGLIALASGQHRVEVQPTSEFQVESLSLRPFRVPPAPAAVTPDVISWEAVRRVVRVDESDTPRTVELSENANAGWVATLDGEPLEPLRVDGWRQAWFLPAGAAGEITMVFSPDAAYRWGLLIGLVAALGLLALAFVPARSGTGAPSGPRQPLPRVLLLLGAGVLAVTAGPWGLLVAAGVGSVTWLLPRAIPGAWVLLGAGLIVLSASIPWPGRLSAPEAPLTALQICALGLLALTVVPRRRPRSRGGSSAAGGA